MLGFLKSLSPNAWKERKCSIEKECCRNCKYLQEDAEYQSWWCENKSKYVYEVDNVVCDLFFNEHMRLVNFDKDNNFRKTNKID